MRERERLHRFIYRCFRLPAVKLVLHKYHFKTDKMKDIGENYIILANHTTEVDMVMVAAAFPQHMYFVCGEHLLRTKFGKALQKYFDPIPAPRGASHAKAVMEIMRRLKNGNNIMLFPEGCRSFNGETIPVTRATGKLVKRAGCALVTYRTSGGYFVAPRWAHHFRKGHMEGRIAGVYSSAELKEMTPQQITDIINRDLHENAYEVQRANPLPYTGEDLADGLENYLLICPKCGRYDTLKTEHNRFSCSCGLSGTIDEYGFLQGDDLPYDTVYDWGEWMKTRFDTDTADKPDDELLFTETETRLYEISAADHTNTDLAVGDVEIYRNKIVAGGREFAYSDISELSLLYYGRSVLFTHSSGYFGITGEHFHAWKIERLWENQLKR